MEPVPPDAAAGTETASPDAVAAAEPQQTGTPDKRTSDGLCCPVCLESVTSLKAQQRGFLVTRCGHWFCAPCLKGSIRRSRECPVCRSRLPQRTAYNSLYL
ncbi:E3 ubiquitin-protein ligase RNF4-like [Pollicipes pollicipes]|uniref:E3 ubiquitin-protein ligase RNF4-like n=1 Tax=Pollicipes pollicipes TaxID=41117 RepID=UPI001884DDFB|nr:E3 ubiquitin-protein ligase RNF4-like [Pollicipes pollicipes]